MPFSTTAATIVPSAEDVTEAQFLAAPVDLTSAQFAPESLEVWMFPPYGTAAIIVPLEEDVMLYQFLVELTEVSSAHAATTLRRANTYQTDTSCEGVLKHRRTPSGWGGTHYHEVDPAQGLEGRCNRHLRSVSRASVSPPPVFESIQLQVKNIFFCNASCLAGGIFF